MNRRMAISLCLVASSLAYAFAQNDAPARARYELDQGVAAYKSANYEKAIEHFGNAVRLEPDLPNARLYLANSLAQQYVPGVETPDNVKMATDAIQQYLEVLKMQADSINALKGIGSLYMQLKKFEDAKQYYQRAIAIDPNDPELYYSAAVMDWMEVYRALAEERATMNLKPSQTFIFDAVCRDLRAKNMPVVEEGMTMLTKAISLRPDYDDAMVYMNLLYRSRADLECGDAQARTADERKADQWADLAMEARRKRIEGATEK